ncbi:MAG: TPM domain-containing protein [Patescibacteria group bacterium]|nr:TPM domain-containing protein [Patescibacteria group bacterium]
MKKIFTAVILTVVSLTMGMRMVYARQFPKPINYVSDFANIISENTEKELNLKLKSFKDSTSNEISIVTLSSLEGNVIENTAVEVFEQWGIGTKGNDNGILLLIASNERKLKIEVGYGLEPVLTDSRAGTIIRSVITPEFKNNNYDAGISKGVDAIIQVISKDPTIFDNINSTTNFNSSQLDALIFLGIILIYLSAFLARSKRWWPGGVIGAILGFIFVSITGAITLGILGLILDFLLSKNYKKRKKHGLPTSWFSSMGGFSSGRSSGGFGGFSGGSSGGGGASGSW